jgi:hypothetical protein
LRPDVAINSTAVIATACKLALDIYFNGTATDVNRFVDYDGPVVIRTVVIVRTAAVIAEPNMDPWAVVIVAPMMVVVMIIPVVAVVVVVIIPVGGIG